MTLLSWYDLSLKLHLPELIEQGHNSQMTVMENLVSVLIQESSVRSRRPADVIMSGLATLPKLTLVTSKPERQTIPSVKLMTYVLLKT